MDVKYLFEDNIYGNGNPTYYLDEKCENLYTGHVEIYYKNIISEEFDVVNGVRNGIQKLYENGHLYEIDEVKNNVISGFGLEYYSSGKIKSISLNYKDHTIISFSYSEDTALIDRFEISDKSIAHLEYEPLKLQKMMSKEELEKMNEEILTYGHPLNLPKGFEFVTLDE